MCLLKCLDILLPYGPKLVCELICCCCLLPIIPAVTICIPTINNDIPTIIPARIAPNNGDASTNEAITTFSTPAPIRNPLT